MASLLDVNRCVVIGVPLFAVLLILICGYPIISAADNLNPGVYPKDSAPFGIPYKDWIARWWQWNVGIPSSLHPREDYTPLKCTINQTGPVWFLADNLKGHVERQCTVPSGKAILVPLLTGWCDVQDDPVKYKDNNELRLCARAGNEGGKISAKIDGREIKDLQQYRDESGIFNLTLHPDNIFKDAAGTWKAGADGFFVFLEPLPTGAHTLDLSTSVVNPLQPKFNYGATISYNITAKE